MDFLQTLNNNIRYDIWGNFQMSRQVGLVSGCSFLARKSWALAKAVLRKRVLIVNNTRFFDTWNG